MQTPVCAVVLPDEDDVAGEPEVLEVGAPLDEELDQPLDELVVVPELVPPEPDHPLDVPPDVVPPLDDEDDVLPDEEPPQSTHGTPRVSTSPPATRATQASPALH